MLLACCFRDQGRKKKDSKRDQGEETYVLSKASISAPVVRNCKKKPVKTGKEDQRSERERDSLLQNDFGLDTRPDTTSSTESQPKVQGEKPVESSGRETPTNSTPVFNASTPLAKFSTQAQICSPTFTNISA